MNVERPVLPLSSDDELWAALVRRDRTADGAFYYAVRSTGVIVDRRAQRVARDARM